jgi:hypothetical protein
MRSLGLLAITLVVYCACSAAQSSTGNSPRSPESRDPLPTWRMFHHQQPDLDLFHSEDARGTYCFTMRTYTVARERPNSDATHLVSYTTCPRADWELQFRNADDKPGSPDN